jgi:hypothetical protein
MGRVYWFCRNSDRVLPRGFEVEATMARVKAGCLGLGVAISLFPATAWGQAASFGRQGQFAVSGERLVGLFVHRADVESEGTATTPGPLGGTVNLTTDNEIKSTEFVVLGNNNSIGPAATPRVAFDFFPIDGLSLGGALLYEHDSSDDDQTGTTDQGGGGIQPSNRTQTEVSTSNFGIAPRVGYAYMFTPMVGIWPRGGISYVVSNTEETVTVTDPNGDLVTDTNTDRTIKHLSLTLEGLLVLAPIDHIAIGVGPFFEVPLSGSVEIDSTITRADPLPDTQISADGDVKITSYGVTSALIAWF